jgi:hypothetical protein
VLSIKECSREERLERALLAIEGLTYCFDEGGITAEDFSAKTYMIAHVAPNKCGNPHEDWLLLIEEIEKSCKELNIYNVEKTLLKSKEKLNG